MTSARRKVQKDYFFKTVESPVGLVASRDGLAAILWEQDNPRRVRLNILAKDENHPILLETERQLKEYSPPDTGRPARLAQAARK